MIRAHLRKQVYITHELELMAMWHVVQPLISNMCNEVLCYTPIIFTNNRFPLRYSYDIVWRFPSVSTLLTPRFNEVEGGILDSPCPSVCLPVSRIRSVSSTIVAGSVSYLHVLSFLGNFFKCVTLTSSFVHVHVIWNLKLNPYRSFLFLAKI